MLIQVYIGVEETLIETQFNKRRWFSGRIRRCHRRDPGSIPGRRILLLLFLGQQAS